MFVCFFLCAIVLSQHPKMIGQDRLQNTVPNGIDGIPKLDNLYKISWNGV